MGSANLVVACWCLLGQVPNDVFYTNQRDHRVGVEFNDAERSAIKEVRLFASKDPEHKDWQLMGRYRRRKIILCSRPLWMEITGCASLW